MCHGLTPTGKSAPHSHLLVSPGGMGRASEEQKWENSWVEIGTV